MVKPVFFHRVKSTTPGLAQIGSLSQSGGWTGRPVASANFQTQAASTPMSRFSRNWKTSAAATALVTTGMK